MIPKSYVENLAVSPEIVEEDLAATYVGDLVDWTRLQALDSNIRQCMEYLQANKKPHKKETGHNPMIREYNRMKLINNIFYRITNLSYLLHIYQQCYKPYMMIWDIQEKTKLYICYETDFTGQECTKMQSPGLSNVEDVFDENSNQSESTVSTHSNFFTIKVGLHGFSHVSKIQRRIPAYFGHHGSIH
jgi:hypothetical protein